MKRWLCFIALGLLLFSGCVTKTRYLGKWVHKIDSEELSEVVIRFAVHLEHERNLYLEHSRVFFDDKIEKLRLDFSSQDIIELCRAREDLVYVVEGLLKRINEHMLLRGQLAHRPFTAKDLDIHITYESYHARYVNPMYIGYTILENGRSYFYTSELNTRGTDYWQRRTELYSKTREFARFYAEAEAPYIERAKEEAEIKHLRDERLIN